MIHTPKGLIRSNSKPSRFWEFMIIPERAFQGEWPLKTEYTCNFFRCFGVFIRYKNNLFHVPVFRIFRAFKWYVNYYELSNFVLVYECHIYWKLYIINRVSSSLGTDRQRRTMKIVWKISKLRGTRPSYVITWHGGLAHIGQSSAKFLGIIFHVLYHKLATLYGRKISSSVHRWVK